MITVNSNKINTLDQISYNNLINSINITQITCSCGHSGCLTKHAYYFRNLKISGGIKVRICVLRVKCSVCAKTHAVLPDTIVPYSQITLKDHIVILCNTLQNKSHDGVMNDNPLIDESSIGYIVRCYKKHWKQRLKAYRINLCEQSHHLTTLCFKYFQRQFMQIKCTTNILFTFTHIT